MPGDAAQTAILEAAEAGRRVQMLCWHDHLPAAHAQSRGNGYLFSALPQVESDGAFALGSGPVLRFSLSQCGGQRTGHVRRDNHGRLLFAPLAPR